MIRQLLERFWQKIDGPLIGIVLLHSGWRTVFYVAGAIGMAWVLWWALSYRAGSTDPRRSVRPVPISKLLSIRIVQVLIFAKFMSGPSQFRCISDTTTAEPKSGEVDLWNTAIPGNHWTRATQILRVRSAT